MVVITSSGSVYACAVGVAGVAEGMQQLQIGGGGDAASVRGRDSQRRGALRYVGADTRPPHVTSKQGRNMAVMLTAVVCSLCISTV